MRKIRALLPLVVIACTTEPTFEPLPEEPLDEIGVLHQRDEERIAEMSLLKIMPLGDSLTEGYFLPSLGGYRIYLDPLLRGFRLRYDLVGSMSTGPDSLLDKDNEGHQGQSYSYFISNFPGWYAAHPCDVVLSHVGTAHIVNNGAGSGAGMAALLTSLLDTMYAQNSSLIVIVAKLPPLTGAYAGLNVEVDTYNASIPAVVTAQVALGRRVSIVDMNSIGVTTSDGAHPTDDGYHRMADAWFPAVKLALGWDATDTVANTTLNAITDSYVIVLRALTPTSMLSDKTFDESPRRYPIEAWSTKQNSSSAVFRRFQFRRTGVAEDPPLLSATEVERMEQVELVVSYPVMCALYGTEELRDLEECMRADAHQIRDAIFSSTNWLNGQHNAAVQIQPPDMDESGVWYQKFLINVHYTESQSI